MQVFINELSLEGQYFTTEEFTEAVKIFRSIFSLINEKIKEKQMYKDSLFVNREAIKNENFQASFQRIRDKSLKDAFRDIIFNRLNPRDWRLEQMHSTDDWFQCNDELVTDTSMAELAERRMQNTDLIGILVNFSTSRFARFSSVTVSKNEKNFIDLDCVENKTSFETWLELKLKLSSFEYDYTSTLPPTDTQTVLKDNNRFTLTSLLFQGRKIYREVQTSHYWYVDNLHYGNAAHLEVFSSSGKHLGEANLDGDLDGSKMDPRKRLDFE